jgi:hypothetical protein
MQIATVTIHFTTSDDSWRYSFHMVTDRTMHAKEMMRALCSAVLRRENKKAGAGFWFWGDIVLAATVGARGLQDRHVRDCGAKPRFPCTRRAAAVQPTASGGTTGQELLFTQRATGRRCHGHGQTRWPFIHLQLIQQLLFGDKYGGA